MALVAPAIETGAAIRVRRMTLPDPLTPPDSDLRGMEWMPLYGHRLFGSDFDITATDAEFRAGLNLWWSAWNQVPAASLPKDEVALCRFAGCGRDTKAWKKIRARAMHAFVECADGRLYHKALAPFAVESWNRRLKDRERKARLREKAREQHDGTGKGPVTERARGADGTRNDTGTGRGQDAERGRDRTADEMRRDETGRDATPANDQRRSPGPPPPQAASIETKRKAMEIVERHFPNITNDLRAYPGLTSTQGMIEAWLAEGADPERDVFPAIEGECIKLVAKNRPPRGFGWFAEAVAANKARNDAALPSAAAQSDSDAEAEAKLRALYERKYAETGIWEERWNWRDTWGVRPDRRKKAAA